MKIGFIGAGNVAKTYAKQFVSHGHQVVLSNSRGPESLNETIHEIGPGAKAGTVAEAAQQDLVILCVRWAQAKAALSEVPDWNGRILVDATNRPSNENNPDQTSSEVIATYARGAHLVKALNTLVVNWIQDFSEIKPKLVMFLSGDDVDAKRLVTQALEESGFAAVDLGGLVEGGKLQQFGGPLNALHMNLIKRPKS